MEQLTIKTESNNRTKCNKNELEVQTVVDTAYLTKHSRFFSLGEPKLQTTCLRVDVTRTGLLKRVLFSEKLNEIARFANALCHVFMGERMRNSEKIQCFI